MWRQERCASTRRPLATQKIIVGILHPPKERADASGQATLTPYLPGLVTPGRRGRDPKDHILKEARIGLHIRTIPDPDKPNCPGHPTYEPCSKKKHDAKRMPGQGIHTESRPYNGWLLGRMEASRLECQYRDWPTYQQTKHRQDYRLRRLFRRLKMRPYHQASFSPNSLHMKGRRTPTPTFATFARAWLCTGETRP